MLQATAVVRRTDMHMISAVLRWNVRTRPVSVFANKALGANIQLQTQANAALDHADGSSISGVTDRVSEARARPCCPRWASVTEVAASTQALDAATIRNHRLCEKR